MNCQHGQSFRVAFLTATMPGLFGPYAGQLQAMAREFVGCGHHVTWMSITTTVGLDHCHDQAFECIRLKTANNNSPVFVSEINAHLSNYSTDFLISLMDLNRVFVDDSFSAPSIAWFPNHFHRLDPSSRHALCAFDAVASLSPSDAQSIALQLPHKIVRHVPHIVVPPRQRRSKASIRAAFDVPPGAFLVLVLFANYDANNRKAFDVSLLAFEKLLAARPESFLFVHALGMRALSRGLAHEDGINVNLMLNAVGLPKDRYRLSVTEKTDAEIFDLMRIADVLLHPSRAEGFGMPILEAQSVGTPVVTTRFGAMADFTIHGTSVPHLQLHFMAQGFVAMPDVHGTARALLDIAREGGAPFKDDAIRHIRDTMNPQIVRERMQSLMTAVYELKSHEYCTCTFGHDPLRCVDQKACDTVVIHNAALALDRRAVNFAIETLLGSDDEVNTLLIDSLSLELERLPGLHKPHDEWIVEPTVVTRRPLFESVATGDDEDAASCVELLPYLAPFHMVSSFTVGTLVPLGPWKKPTTRAAVGKEASGQVSTVEKLL